MQLIKTVALYFHCVSIYSKTAVVSVLSIVSVCS